jgi:asparagine synthase (glutamine-hydrolysing)
MHRARTLEGFDDPRFPVLEWIVRPLVVPLIPLPVRRRMAQRKRVALESWAGPHLRDVARRLWDRKLELTLANPPPRDTQAYFDHPQRRHFLWSVHQEQRAGALERHDPYFTHEVAATMAAIPAETVLAGGRRRGLLREVMRGKVPDSILERSDKAIFSPAFSLFFEAAGGVKAFAEELEVRTLSRLGIVEANAFRRDAVEALSAPAEDARYGYAWTVLAAEAFFSRRPELT